MKFLLIVFLLKTVFWKSIYILCIVNFKSYRMQNIEIQESWAAKPTFEDKVHFAYCCLLHRSAFTSMKQDIQFETGYKFRQSHRAFKTS